MEPIHIFSDVICPWCFVGRVRLAKALKQLDLKPAILWHPFELNPDTPVAGVDRHEYLVEKFGGESVLEMADERLKALAEQEGIPFNFEGMKRIPNTFQAHRLIALAEASGKGDQVADLLFRANFMQGKDVSDLKVLVEAGLGVGLDAKQVEGHLLGNEGAEALRLEEEEARRMGLRGVPYYIINEQRFYGAQEVETFASALRAGKA
jgi:predicted DsbA family dithiol-disulfide isomerase